DAVAVRGREGLIREAAFGKRGNFGFVRRPEAIRELGQRPAVIAHLEAAASDRLGGAAPREGRDDDLERCLLEAAYLDLPVLAHDDRLDAIAGDVIAADLHLREHAVLEPDAQERIVEVLFGGRERVTVDAR